ncbi:hypothetical protein [Paenibacillus odorifer]|nr:hypothetical protein [Paenibacillus odorifer]
MAPIMISPVTGAGLSAGSVIGNHQAGNSADSINIQWQLYYNK